MLVVGVGALGTHAASALARAGVGRLWLVDRDVVSLDNLQRQLLFDEADAAHGRPKAIAAAERLAAINGDCETHAWVDQFDAHLFDGLPEPPDAIVDGTDNFATRYLINDLARRAQRPWAYGGVLGSRGTAAVFRPDRGPCLRCLIPQAPAPVEAGSCETEGVLQPVVATVTAFQCGQLLRLLVEGDAAPPSGVLEVDPWRAEYRVRLLSAPPADDCPVCAGGRWPALEDDAAPTVELCGRDAVQIRPPPDRGLDLETLAHHLAAASIAVERTPHLLRFSAEGSRFSVFPGGRALIFGAGSPQRAQALYDRHVGAR